MPISTSDATAAINALAGASTDPSARVAANPGARASVISPLGYPRIAEGRIMILPVLSSTTRKSRGRMIFPANICVR
jgi:hypothetical protein